MLGFASPFFLKRILDAIDDPTPDRRAQAFIFACLAFAARSLKAETDLQHLYHGRRAGFRVKQEVMAVIYDKALKRKDFSGIANLKKDKAADEGKGKSKDGRNADIGKIVNLMSMDANHVSRYSLLTFPTICL